MFCRDLVNFESLTYLYRDLMIVFELEFIEVNHKISSFLFLSLSQIIYFKMPFFATS